MLHLDSIVNSSLLLLRDDLPSDDWFIRHLISCRIKYEEHTASREMTELIAHLRDIKTLRSLVSQVARTCI